MHLVQLNIGAVAPLGSAEREVPSGIRKLPVAGPVAIGPEGCAGDAQADHVNHAGPDKAVCCYATEHLGYWSERVGHTFAAGAFGENFSLRGLVETETRIGDVIEVGTASFEVSQPRGPCFKLGLLHDEPQLALWVQQTGRTGFYLRCLKPGLVGAGQPIRLIERHPAYPTIDEVARVTYRDPDDTAAIDRVIACPALAPSWHDWLVRRRDKRR